jgi:hypothetical protein
VSSSDCSRNRLPICSGPAFLVDFGDRTNRYLTFTSSSARRLYRGPVAMVVQRTFRRLDTESLTLAATRTASPVLERFPLRR